MNVNGLRAELHDEIVSHVACFIQPDEVDESPLDLRVDLSSCSIEIKVVNVPKRDSL